MNYYNEIDPKAAAWLREVINAKLIPEGKIDERSITEVTASDLDGFTQCHFFAGIGGWSYALQLAGWPSDRPVWTGSCPCQPFSHAGKQKGTADARHLWPEFARLISQCKPPTVFGEQVASELGREWLHGVFTDLEGMGYAAAGADLCAASVGAPHIRQRLYWVADSKHSRPHREEGIEAEQNCNESRCGILVGGGDGNRGVVQSDGTRLEQGQPPATPTGYGSSIESAGSPGWMGNADEPGSQGRGQHAGKHTDQRTPWEASELIHCRDGKSRRVKSGLCVLAHGVSGRVGLLRGYGNAIVPQVAAEFVKAFIDTTNTTCHSDRA